eukprot:Amastigsp_a176036_25.p2 type:complete len:166 gc:universal Amastigsp_a176036_25:1241-1738(+)
MHGDVVRCREVLHKAAALVPLEQRKGLSRLQLGRRVVAPPADRERLLVNIRAFVARVARRKHGLKNRLDRAVPRTHAHLTKTHRPDDEVLPVHVALPEPRIRRQEQRVEEHGAHVLPVLAPRRNVEEALVNLRQLGRELGVEEHFFHVVVELVRVERVARVEHNQ